VPARGLEAASDPASSLAAGAHARHAGVVDEHVDLAGGSRELRHLRRVGEVGDEAAGVDPLRPEIPGAVVHPLGRGPEDDPEPLAPEAAGAGQADARRAAGSRHQRGPRHAASMADARPCSPALCW
jgi:hypothetical protein